MFDKVTVFYIKEFVQRYCIEVPTNSSQCISLQDILKEFGRVTDKHFPNKLTADESSMLGLELRRVGSKSMTNLTWASSTMMELIHTEVLDLVSAFGPYIDGDQDLPGHDDMLFNDKQKLPNNHTPIPRSPALDVPSNALLQGVDIGPVMGMNAMPVDILKGLFSVLDDNDE
jgi:hypothetical protein